MRGKNTIFGSTAMSVYPQLPTISYMLSAHLQALEVCAASITSRMLCYCPPRLLFSLNFLQLVESIPRAIILGNFIARHTSLGGEGE